LKKEKQIEKDLRDKERADFSNSSKETKNSNTNDIEIINNTSNNEKY